MERWSTSSTPSVWIWLTRREMRAPPMLLDDGRQRHREPPQVAEGENRPLFGA